METLNRLLELGDEILNRFLIPNMVFSIRDVQNLGYYTTKKYTKKVNTVKLVLFTHFCPPGIIKEKYRRCKVSIFKAKTCKPVIFIALLFVIIAGLAACQSDAGDADQQVQGAVTLPGTVPGTQ